MRTTNPIRSVLVLAHHEGDHVGLVGDAFASRGIEVASEMVNDAWRRDACAEHDAVVVLGSTNAVYDEHIYDPWFRREQAVLRDAHDRGKKILGICFGAQTLCVLFGGQVSRAAEPEIGWYDVAVPGGEFPSGPWFEYHYDSCQLPNDARVLASTPRAVQAFEVRGHLGVQFHPEVDHAQLSDWFAADEAIRDGALDIDALLRTAREHADELATNADALVQYFLERDYEPAP